MHLGAIAKHVAKLSPVHLGGFARGKVQLPEGLLGLGRAQGAQVVAQDGDASLEANGQLVEDTGPVCEGDGPFASGILVDQIEEFASSLR